VFIEDASRFLVNCSLLTEKSSIATSEFLKETMDMGLAIPYCIWSDTGGEFTSKLFREVLSRHGMILKTMQVRTRQQNGKIQRFWQNVKLTQDRDHLNSILDESNHRPHTGVPKMRFRRKLVCRRPAERYLSISRPGKKEGGHGSDVISCF
jgi:transposase InsO family protein